MGGRPTIRKVDYDEYVRANRARFAAAWLASQARSPQRQVRRKPRSPEEQAVLRLLMEERRQQALATGDLQRLGPRRYRLRVRFE